MFGGPSPPELGSRRGSESVSVLGPIFKGPERVTKRSPEPPKNGTENLRFWDQFSSAKQSLKLIRKSVCLLKNVSG